MANKTLDITIIVALRALLIQWQIIVFSRSLTNGTKQTGQNTQQVLKGNDDVSTPVKNELTPPIVGANVIRILPFSQHLKTVCMRFELHGCTYDGK